MEKTLDCTGLACPLPVVRTNQAMKELAAGDRLRLISTDRGSANDIPSWAKRTGHALVSAQEDGGKFVFVLEKAG
ncbi:MAG: sulfurtransferase TusA family protein [Nitrospirae bacterium]|nr:sulfurtransferase TusA family protein [Nitrospirota bacterium]